MKKVLCVILASVLLLGCMAGCGSKGGAANPQPPAVSEPPAASEPPASPGTPDASEPPAQEDYGTIPAHISIGTNPAGQAAYTMGAGIADVINKANIGTTVAVEETNGYPVNVQLMMNKEIEFGFVNNLMAAQAYTATAGYSDYEAGQVLSVMTLAPTEMHIIVPAGSDVKTIYDFAGKRVGVGQPGGIALEVTSMFLEAIGYKEGDVERLEINLQNQCDYMQDGQLDVLVWIGSAPLAAITGLCATKDIQLLEIDDEAIAKMQEICPVAKKVIIPAGSYNGQDEEVSTFGLRNMIVARADLSNETVYQFTKLIMENVDALGAVHAAMKDISPETVTNGMSSDTPLHPGALRYYQEIGMTGLDEYTLK